jgi:hypothetical protein
LEPLPAGGLVVEKMNWVNMAKYKNILFWLCVALLFGSITMAMLLTLHDNGVIVLAWRRQSVSVEGIKPGKQGENIYIFRLSQKGFPSNQRTIDRIELYEDGSLLGPNNSLRVEIGSEGAGRYLLEQNNLFFSSSDNSDPRVNGRQYMVAIPRAIPLFWVYLAWGLTLSFAVLLSVLVGQRNRSLRFLWGLPLLLAVNVFLRSVLEQSDARLYAFLPRHYPSETVYIFSHYPWWRLLLPLKELTGVWNANLIMTHILEQVLTPAQVWYLFFAALIIVSFALSWYVFRSTVFSYTLAICLGFGTHLHHTYAVSGTVSINLLIILFLILLFLAYKIISSEEKKLRWQVLFVAILILTAIQYEVWLDFLVFGWGSCLFLFVYFYRNKERKYMGRLLFIVVTTNLVAFLYLYLKIFAFPMSHASGTESDMVFNYPVMTPLVEDLISNYFTQLYMVVTNFLPPQLLFSNSLYLYGSDQLIEWQNGYHQAYSSFVPMHYIFLWRYYAGGVAVLFFIGLYKLVKKSWERSPTNKTDYVILSIFMVMMAVGGPTHMLVKFRPMKSMPLLGYHVMVGVLGAALVISYLLMMARRNMRNTKLSYLVVGIVWGIVFLAALTRPVYLGEMSRLVGVNTGGGYPNPWQTLLELISSFFK